MRTRALALLTVGLLAASGCGTEPAPRTTTSSASPTKVDRPLQVPAADGEVTTSYPVTVLDDGGGAELCLGGAADSYPPQCGGPPVVGWDWTEHEGDFESASGVRWGDFVVAGTFDGTALTPTSIVPADEHESEPVDYEALADEMFATPCPEPDGGWILDPARASERDEGAAFRVARGLDDYGSSFVDNSLDPRSPEQVDQGAELPRSPAIVNVSVTDDLAAAEAAIRVVWGGGLCVSEATYTDAELARAQDAVNDLPGFAGSGRSPDQVELSVTYDDGSIQAWVDQEYGAGLVLVASALVDA